MPQDAKYWENRQLDDEEKDWLYPGSWLEGYQKSIAHPHRQLIMNSLNKLKNIESVLEMGCCTGPNLLRISQAYPNAKLAGYDVSEPAIQRAKVLLPRATLKVGNHISIPFKEKFDVVVADATLMYISPQEIKRVMNELDRVTKRVAILVERDADSMEGEITSHVWGRDYTQWLELLGFRVETIKITEEQWPHSKGWAQFGHLYVGSRVQ